MTTNLFADPKFWTAIAFVIFVLATFKPIKSLLIGYLDKKIDTIKTDINKAEEVKEEALKLLSDFQLRQKNLNKEIAAIGEKMDSKLKKIKQEMNIKSEIHLKRLEEMTNNKIKQLELDAINLIKEKTVDLTMKASKDVISATLDLDLKEKLLNNSLQDFSHSQKN